MISRSDGQSRTGRLSRTAAVKAALKTGPNPMGSVPHRLQALEGQALGIPDPGQIEPADEGGDRLPVAIGQRNDGINGNTLGVHGLPRSDRSLKPPSVEYTG